MIIVKGLSGVLGDDALVEQLLGGPGHLQLVHHPLQLVHRPEGGDLLANGSDAPRLLPEEGLVLVLEPRELLIVLYQVRVDDGADLFVLRRVLNELLPILLDHLL